MYCQMKNMLENLNIRCVTFYGRRTMKMIKKVLNKIAYIFICINQDIKMRYKIQKEVEDDVLQLKKENVR